MQLHSNNKNMPFPFNIPKNKCAHINSTKSDLVRTHTHAYARIRTHTHAYACIRTHTHAHVLVFWCVEQRGRPRLLGGGAPQRSRRVQKVAAPFDSAQVGQDRPAEVREYLVGHLAHVKRALVEGMHGVEHGGDGRRPPCHAAWSGETAWNGETACAGSRVGLLWY